MIKTIIIIVSCLILITLIVAFISYRMAFYSPKKRISNVYNIPDNNQGVDANKVITDMIGDMLSR